uniref:SCP domain-containing protein n=1 Tax=Strongyloides papillosus TaxID=174720 RepID=A0A0N5BHQ8_STREA
MYIFNSNYYITFIILLILFFQYHALESNVENDNSALLNFAQNDLSSKNFINQDSLIHSISENKYLRKRQVGVKQEQKKSVLKKKTKQKPLSKTTFPPRPPPKKPSGRRTVPPKNKRPAPKTTTGKTTTKKSITKKPSTSRPPKRLTKTSYRPVTRTLSRITTKKPVIPAKKTPKPTKRPAETTKKHEKTTNKLPPTQTTTKKSPRPVKTITLTQKSKSTTTTNTSLTSKPASPATNTETSSTSASTSPISTTNPSTTTETLSTSSPTSSISTTILSTTTQNFDIYAFEKETLIKDINFARELHQADELTLDSELAKKAQNLTDESAQKGMFVPFENDTVGLLTYHIKKEEDNEDFGFSQWFSGSISFNFKNPENNLHHHSSFTQLVWAESKNIGCGISKNNKHGIFVACLFYPKGNIKGKYSDNVREEISNY